MSYALSGPLQAAVFEALRDDAEIQALIGTGVFDAIPTGNVPDTYISIGAERVQDASDRSGDGAVHRLDINVITSQPGFALAKKVAGAVSDVLHHADLPLSRGRLVFLHFERAEARRIDAKADRKIRLRFRARVEDQ